MNEFLKTIFKKASEKLSYLNNIELIFEVPKSRTNGDLSTNAAMLLTKQLRKNPKQIAEEIISNLEYSSDEISRIEIAGPGFINFYFNPKFISSIIKEINLHNDDFGKSKKYNGKRANVEFVSANPTGPLTVGHGRNAVIGDTIANLLEWVGYDVDREYYFNNAGRQMRVLGDSVRLRYLQLLGKKVTFPEDYYQGEYIREIAKELQDQFGDSLQNQSAESIFKQRAEANIFADIKNSLKRLGIEHKIFYNENSLYEEKKIDSILNTFKLKNHSYEKDGAIWLKFSELGQEQDKVIVKSSGEPTYRLPDIAYHITKFERGYDLLVDLFGSDHNATYPDVLAGIKALGYDPSIVKVLIHQFVTIMQGDEIVKMSTRKANFITLDELIDEVGSDVVRYFFNMRNISSHMNFDLNLAKKHSDENPVFYLQYAHARICSILRMADTENISPSFDSLDLLKAEEELDLIKKFHQFRSEILSSAELCETNKLCNYLEELAALFHHFYTVCRIIGSERKLAEARLALIVAVKIVLRNGLSILGVSAPDKM